MAQYPRTNSILDSGRSRTGLSTQIVVYANGEPVGAIQSFQESQSKSVKKIENFSIFCVVDKLFQK